MGYKITSVVRNEVNPDISNDLEDVIKLNYFKPEIPFPMGTGVIKISVANSN